MSLCKYKDSLGKPNEGVHSYRLFGIAVVDVILTILLAAFISFITNTPFVYTMIATFIAGIFAHRLFCVRTKVDTLLFPSNTNSASAD